MNVNKKVRCVLPAPTAAVSAGQWEAQPIAEATALETRRELAANVYARVGLPVTDPVTAMGIRGDRQGKRNPSFSAEAMMLPSGLHAREQPLGLDMKSTEATTRFAAKSMISTRLRSPSRPRLATASRVSVLSKAVALIPSASKSSSCNAISDGALCASPPATSGHGTGALTGGRVLSACLLPDPKPKRSVRTRLPAWITGRSAMHMKGRCGVSIWSIRGQ